MKIHFSVLLSLLPLCAVKGQQPTPNSEIPAAIASELAEYTTKRTEGVKKLADAAKAELLAIQQQQMQAGNLEATNAITKAIEQLPILSQEDSTPPEGLPPAAVKAMSEHAAKVSSGISGLNVLFLQRMEKLKSEMLKSGNIAGANAAATKVQELQEEAEKLNPVKSLTTGTADEFTVEALIDGNTQLHITKEGLYWMVPGGEAKPGLHDGANEATYINGRRWKPQWRVKGDRGPDTSDVYPIRNTAPKLVCETVKVSRERFAKNEVRTPVVPSIKDDHFVVTIRDPEGGSRWYKLRIKSAP